VYHSVNGHWVQADVVGDSVNYSAGYPPIGDNIGVFHTNTAFVFVYGNGDVLVVSEDKIVVKEDDDDSEDLLGEATLNKIGGGKKHQWEVVGRVPGTFLKSARTVADELFNEWLWSYSQTFFVAYVLREEEEVDE